MTNLTSTYSDQTKRCVGGASLYGGADMSLVTRHQCCWSDFAEHSSTVPHSTCACIHVDLHVCSPCQSLPHSARLSAPSAQSLKIPDSARNSAGIIRRPLLVALENLRNQLRSDPVHVCAGYSVYKYCDCACVMARTCNLYCLK